MQENKIYTLEDDLAVMETAARRAGDIALQFFRQNPRVWMKEGNSPVSEADLAVDTFLKETLLAARPGYGWLSEESADERVQHSYRRSFVVDPIDGTRGFIDGSKNWCISIAVIEGDRPVAGVLACPAKGEYYSAAKGGSARLNNEIIKAVTKGPKVISCPTSLQSHLPEASRHKFQLAGYIPSLAYRIALVAKGDIDLVLVRANCHDWDIAAADIILAQSGGVLSDKEGQDVRYGTSPYRHGFLIAVTAETDGDMLDIVDKAALG